MDAEEHCAAPTMADDGRATGWECRVLPTENGAAGTNAMRVAEDAAARSEIAATAADDVVTSDLRRDPTQFPEYLCTAMRRSDD